MELKKIQFTPKQSKILGINQIYILKFKKPIFLENTEKESINLLRAFFEPDYTQEQKEEFKLFWDIIANFHLKRKIANKQTEEKKQRYYQKLAIDSKKRKIERLKEEIKKLRK